MEQLCLIICPQKLLHRYVEIFEGGVAIYSHLQKMHPTITEALIVLLHAQK